MTRWTQDIEAAAILADCAERPPAKQEFKYRFGETDVRYIGERVKRLHKIRSAYLERALQYDDVTGEQTFEVELKATVDGEIDARRHALQSQREAA